jgi:hypothetical protein
MPWTGQMSFSARVYITMPVPRKTSSSSNHSTRGGGQDVQKMPLSCHLCVGEKEEEKRLESWVCVTMSLEIQATSAYGSLSCKSMIAHQFKMSSKPRSKWLRFMTEFRARTTSRIQGRPKDSTRSSWIPKCSAVLYSLVSAERCGCSCELLLDP